MALTYRTPMEDIVSSFEPAMQSAIANKAAIGYKQLEEANFQIANFYLKAEAKQKLSAAGIYLSPFSAVVHSHPVCKTLENHFLYTVLPNYINNKYFFVGIKNSKINLLKSRNSKLDLVQVVNRYVSSKDKCRYSNDFVVRSSAPIEGLDRHKATLAECTLRDLVPNISRVKAKHLFLHDELHYWREKDLITFLEVINPEVLLGTVVFPPELLVGAKRSLNPWCYHFEIEDGKLLFFPDGERSEGYEQPLRGGYLLTTNEIRLPNGQVYCVDLLASKFAHHLFSITKGPAVTNTCRSFGRFEAVSFSGLLDLSPLNQPFFPVSFDIVSKLYRYLRSLKKPDHQSAMAKLSQIVQDPTAEEIKFTQEFADLVINCGTVNSLLSVNRLQIFITRVYKTVLPKFVSDKMKLVKELSLDDFISRLKPYSFTKKLHHIDLTFQLDFNFWSEFQPTEDVDIVRDLESLYNGKHTGAGSSLIPNLHQFSSPYVGMVPLTEGSGRFTLELPSPDCLLKCFAKRVMDALPLDCTDALTIGQINQIIKSCTETSSIVVNWSIVREHSFQKKVLGKVKATLIKEATKIATGLEWFLTRASWRKNTRFISNFEESPKHSFPNSCLWASVTSELIKCNSKLQQRWDSKELTGKGNLLNAASGQSAKGKEEGILLTEGVLEAFGLENLGTRKVEELLLGLTGEAECHIDNEEDSMQTLDSDSNLGFESEEYILESVPTVRPPQNEVNELVSWPVKDLQGYRTLRTYSSIPEAIAFKIGFDHSKVLERLADQKLNIHTLDLNSGEALKLLFEKVATLFKLRLEVVAESDLGTFKVNYLRKSSSLTFEHSLTVFVGKGEVEELHLKNLCVVSAVAEALSRTEGDVIEVLKRPDYQDLAESVMCGQGVRVEDLESIFRVFSIKALVSFGDKDLILNPDGNCCACFKLENNHLSYLSRKVNQVGCIISSGLKEDDSFERGVLMQIETIGSVLDFRAKISRANLLADCMHDGSTGVILSELYNEREHLLKKRESQSDAASSEDFTHKVHAVLGTFGVGKSSLFRRLMSKARGKTFDFVSPRRSLLEEVKSDLNFGKDKKARSMRGQQNWFFETFEKFLLRVNKLKKGQLVFLDEIQLFPSGYLDLIFYLAEVDFHLIVLGDPCQSDYDNEKDRAVLGNITTNVDALLKGRVYKYNVKSYRFLNPNFIGRLPCEFAPELMHKESSPYLIYNDLEQLSFLPFEYGQVILVSSFEEKKIVSSYYPECKNVLTFGESTGLNFHYGTILITMISERAGERRWLTALSRFKNNVALVNATGYSIESLNMMYREKYLGRFLTGRAKVSDLEKYLPGKPEFKEGFDSSVGKDEGIREEKLVGDPWLKSMIDLFQIEDVNVEELQEVVSQVEEFKIHLPRDELEGVRTRWVHKILNKEFREVRMGTIVSDQFTDDHSKQRGGTHLTNAAERFETIYPRHRANDTVTFIMAVKKRLRFSKPHVEAAKLNQAKLFGRYLLQEFLKKIPLKRTHNTQMMEQARQDFFDKKTSKSAATIENHNIRSCRDWLADIVQVFSKSQICTKFDNRFRSAKAAQSIACFQHSVLCRFAPYMRYIEKKLHEVLPARYYIHSGKSLEQLNEWVLKGQFNGVCTESDYEAFDASQDQYIVAFELELMKYLGLPNDLIQDYTYIKTHLGSKLGGFAIMRFTGEASTFLFNTLANMLFTFLRYEIKGNEYICFAGDDMCSSKRLVIKKEHEGFLKKIKLKAKVQHTSKPTFCGWHLSPDGIYKKPQLVFERMCIAKETNNLHNCIDSYAIEVSYAYKMGEKVTQKMDEEEISAYYSCVRTIIKYKHLLKSEVKALYESLE
ncbi:RNA-dependent RNA polymerase [Cowpea mild mottle virus]|uniref:RNA-dependent RNA polymerase n=1 Tax=Cowpea mild mottle virus TaxID=67761 RepID=E5KJF1_9VIRU|nr:RNA-dependent RNA polymerase [Cowpea mild mottle virus]ADQ54107.1 RNA-dependent RNA polymerase [Cowpea mild mottle virus]